MGFLVEIERGAMLVFGVGISVSVAFFVVLERSANGLQGE